MAALHIAHSLIRREPEERGAPSHPIIEKNTMTVQPHSVPPIVPRVDEEEPKHKTETETEHDIPADDRTPVDKPSSSRDGWSRDIEREDDIPADDRTPVDKPSSSRDSLPRDIERE